MAVIRSGPRINRKRTLLTAALAAVVGAASFFLPGTVANADPLNPTLREQAADIGGFRIGVATAADALGDQTYNDTQSAQFNALTGENAFKWSVLEPERGNYDWSGADALYDHAQEKGQDVRMHTFAWHSQAPSWLENGGFSYSELEDILTNHIQTVLQRYNGDFATIDVVNEVLEEDGSFRNSFWYDTMGEDFIDIAFRTAAQYAPDAKLYINDYNVAGRNAKSDAVYSLVQRLESRGVPIDGVGFQSDFVLGEVPSSLESNMQRFADLGLEVAITELDVRIPLPSDESELDQQAADYASVVTACRNNSACNEVTVWGVDDGHSWVPDTFSGYGEALMFTDQYDAKPSFYGAREALGGPGDPDDGDGGDDGGSGDTVLLQSVSAEKCIDVPGGDTTDGTEVQLYSCYEGENQQFTETTGQELQVLGKCLDAPSGGNGDPVQIYTCHGGDNQKWTFNSDGTISNVEYSNVCLDVYSSDNGAPVQLYDCWGGDNQQWNRI
ncbi:endo-1,4-beta-xylanase [Glycomyces xiaoerkulensis]|uniref:endo-1,4-beta-xylanase n=1 Tax=Glycomyces xiaoerkulensis TaxID=2038139 RepID=UPI0012FFDBD9|nr:endo-1,4-beta-xylanase [Glycomyces xiaoerkulensis]